MQQVLTYLLRYFKVELFPRDFLTGFRKRKLQRKKKAQEDLEVQLKVERKRIRLEAKDALKKLVVSHRDIPELGQVRRKWRREYFSTKSENIYILQLKLILGLSGSNNAGAALGIFPRRREWNVCNQ